MDKTIGQIFDELPEFDKELVTGVIAGYIPMFYYTSYYTFKDLIEQKIEEAKNGEVHAVSAGEEAKD